jgi:uncharacterized protein (DUF169 family)
MKNNKDKIDNLELARKLEIYLDLTRKPVGIKFLFTEQEFDEFESDTKNTAMPYCTMVKNATLGKSFKANITNFACYTGAKALGVMNITNDDISGQRHARQGVYKDFCISRNVHKDMVYCQHKVYGVGVKALEEYSIDPDVVIIITSGYGIMRLVQGRAFHFGQTKSVKLTGMNGICQECTSYPYEINDINISGICSGSRHVCQWKKDELGVGIPFNKLSYIVHGIIQTSNLMDRNEDKKRIAKLIDKFNINIDEKILYNQNYYTGVYKSYKHNIDKLKEDK